jgi:hypothetical protein
VTWAEITRIFEQNVDKVVRLLTRTIAALAAA